MRNIFSLLLFMICWIPTIITAEINPLVKQHVFLWTLQAITFVIVIYWFYKRESCQNCKTKFHDYQKQFKKSRCCGRCDGVNDICIGDTKCEPHQVAGCEICFGER